MNDPNRSKVEERSVTEAAVRKERQFETPLRGRVHQRVRLENERKYKTISPNSLPKIHGKASPIKKIKEPQTEGRMNLRLALPQIHGQRDMSEIIPGRSGQDANPFQDYEVSVILNSIESSAKKGEKVRFPGWGLERTPIFNVMQQRLNQRNGPDLDTIMFTVALKEMA
jgi:hypothetical protein